MCEIYYLYIGFEVGGTGRGEQSTQRCIVHHPLKKNYERTTRYVPVVPVRQWNWLQKTANPERRKSNDSYRRSKITYIYIYDVYIQYFNATMILCSYFVPPAFSTSHRYWMGGERRYPKKSRISPDTIRFPMYIFFIPKSPLYIFFTPYVFPDDIFRFFWFTISLIHKKNTTFCNKMTTTNPISAGAAATHETYNEKGSSSSKKKNTHTT